MGKYKFEIVNFDDAVEFDIDKDTNVITVNTGAIEDVFRTPNEMITFTNTLPQILNLLRTCEVHTIEVREE